MTDDRSEVTASGRSAPMMVADLINECVLNEDNVWRFKSHTLRPVFMSSVTPPSIEIDPIFLKDT
jgi:hypothetical protein